jgi:mannitol/fructose-specific phosphotransferase system IIA component (Ntr-type)
VAEMKLSEILNEDLILPALEGTDVPSVLEEFANAICASGKFSDSHLLLDRLYDREKQESTGIGNGVAIPHCKIDHLQDVILSIGYSDQGVDFKAIDGEPTFYFFVVVSPSSSSVMHLRTLAAVSRLLKSPGFLSALRQRPGKKELIALIRQEEETTAVT